MPVSLKPLSEQTIVITGASSGIGLATARMAVSNGARVVLASRNEEVLAAVTENINATGGTAIYVVADVGDRAQVQRIADAATEHFVLSLMTMHEGAYLEHCRQHAQPRGFMAAVAYEHAFVFDC